jgi:hypothetical protein
MTGEVGSFGAVAVHLSNLYQPPNKALSGYATDGRSTFNADIPVCHPQKLSPRQPADRACQWILHICVTSNIFRRVEDHIRPLVQFAMPAASAATKRKERKAAAAASPYRPPLVSNKFQPPPSTPPPSASDARKQSKASVKDAPSTTARRDNDDDVDNGNDNGHRPKEFAAMSSAAPRRLNDIAMAPPRLKKFSRGVKTKHNSPASGGEKAKAGAGAGVLSMEAERESAIKRYREMKERKTKEDDRTLLSTVR